MKFWPFKEPLGYSPEIVQRYCVRDADWQKHRLKMKGTSTETKLVMLHNWYTSHGYSEAGSIDDVEYAARVQVGNYLGALRRGGQLDMNNKVQR